ncbi:MAG: hypothetical protein IJN10_05920 [Firmicutes bacterium]|nr:hypothetical protein [Bacillota bacterium]
MKKSLIILLVLLIAAVAGAGWAAADVNKAKDQIEIEEVILVGDRSMAEGLTVRARNTYDHHLFWDTVYTMEKDSAKAETEFRFSAMRENEVWFSEDEGVHLDSYYVFGFEPGRDDEETAYGLGKAYQELYDTLEPGEEARRVINVRDYLEYYPLHVELDAPGAGFYYMDDEEAYQVLDAEFETKGSAVEAAMFLWNYFRIPVLENEQLEIEVGKSAVSNVTRLGGGNVASTTAIGQGNAGEHYAFSTVSAMTDSVCYFTFDTHSSEGQIVDTSELADGYGIYMLPFHEADQNDGGYEIENFANMYPLDPSIQVIDLSVSADGKDLLLHAVEEGQYVITVIDTETRKLRQRLVICDWPEDGYGWWLYEYENFLAAAVPQDRLMVVSRDEDGMYHLDLLVPVDHDEEDDYSMYLNYNEAMAFDGEKLAVCRTMGGGSCTDFYVAVYDASGLIYYGEYYNSLSAENDMAHAYAGANWGYVYYDSNVPGCEAVFEDPIQLEWK